MFVDGDHLNTEGAGMDESVIACLLWHNRYGRWRYLLTSLMVETALTVILICAA